MKRSSLVVVVFIVCLAGCGARSMTDSVGGRGGQATTDPRDDDSDGATQPTNDASTPSVDSCLTIPASEVQGQYVGTFIGDVSCVPGPVSGTVQFSLTAAGRVDTFSIDGELLGEIETLDASIYSPIEGEMSCTTFSGKLELAISDTEAFFGQMSGEYARYGFPAGRWSVNSVAVDCQGRGTWEARRRR